MIQSAEPAVIEANLAKRLRAVGPVLLGTPAPVSGTYAGSDAGVLLDLLVRAVQADPTPARVWLLCTAASGAYPKPEDLMAGFRFLQLAPPVEATLWLLDVALVAQAEGGRTGELQVVTDRVIVDVHHSAFHDLHTGIQQVVRRTLPIWERDHPILGVAWTDQRLAWRTLSRLERHRVLRRGLDPEAGPDPPPALVVPWRTVVVLAETPPYDACGRLAALAQYSGSVVVAVGHDCIPVVSADLVPAHEPQRFSRYLTVLKYAHGIACVSRSATAEFAGFAAALPAQGLPGPTVLECRLPSGPASGSESPPTQTQSPPTQTQSPLVVCVASLEPRKNHLALLYAAERLWREGLDFRLLLIAGSGWGHEVPDLINRLEQAGRPITTRHSATDAEVVAAYRAARFSVLPSLHEGYGLPAAESLAWGTPVITTNYGSTEQIAADGGALLLDPRNDEALVDAMRRLLTDDHLLGTLQRQTRTRPTRTWEHYAADLWHHLVEPALVDAAAQARVSTPE